MELHEALLKRRSIRKYLDKEISDKNINKLLEAAMAAPSAINSQPWEFYVIKDKKVQGKIKGIAPFYNYNSSLLIVVAGNTKRFIKLMKDFWIEDCAAAVENILVEATNLGLGTCWCGVYPIKSRMNKISKVLSLDKNIIPYALIHVGYPKESKEPRTQSDKKKIHII